MVCVILGYLKQVNGRVQAYTAAAAVGDIPEINGIAGSDAADDDELGTTKC